RGLSVDGSIAASRVDDEPYTKPSSGPGNVRGVDRSGSVPAPALDRFAGTATSTATTAAAATETGTAFASTTQIRQTPAEKSRGRRRNLYDSLRRRSSMTATPARL